MQRQRRVAAPGRGRPLARELLLHEGARRRGPNPGDTMAKTLLLTIVLAAFSALTFYAIGTYGYVGYFQVLLSNLASVHVSADVLIALTLVFVWMSIDAKERGLPFWRYAVLGLFLGSVGPLAYLIHRELRGLRAPQHAAA